MVYNKLAVQKQQDGNNVFVFLDKHCLNYGQDWQDGFINGLKSARVILLLISNKVFLTLLVLSPFYPPFVSQSQYTPNLRLSRKIREGYWQGNWKVRRVREQGKQRGWLRLDSKGEEGERGSCSMLLYFHNLFVFISFISPDITRNTTSCTLWSGQCAIRVSAVPLAPPSSYCVHSY